MKGEWCYFHKYFTKAYCEHVVRIIKTRPYKEATMASDGSNSDNSYRRSNIRWIQPDDPELNDLFNQLWYMAIKANNDWFNFHITNLPYLQVAEYQSAVLGEYKSHHDVFYMNGDPVYHRKLSCVIQLTDPTEYDGGDLVFENITQYPNPLELRQQGSVIFFPSFTMHRATQVTKGDRYSIAGWFEGPKWR